MRNLPALPFRIPPAATVAAPLALAFALGLAAAGCGSGPAASPVTSGTAATPAVPASAPASDADIAGSPEAEEPDDATAEPSVSPEPTESVAPSASPSASPTPVDSPSPAGSPTPIAFGHADLVLDLDNATSDAPGLYSKPTQGCWPVGYNADAAKSTFTVTPDGTLTGHCEQENAIWTIDGDLSGAIDPATGKVTFDLVTKTVYKGQKPGTFALTISGTGLMAGDVAKGDATWTVACTAGTMKCSFDPAHRDTFETAGTVPWTITLLP